MSNDPSNWRSAMLARDQEEAAALQARAKQDLAKSIVAFVLASWYQKLSHDAVAVEVAKML